MKSLGQRDTIPLRRKTLPFLDFIPIKSTLYKRFSLKGQLKPYTSRHVVSEEPDTSRHVGATETIETWPEQIHLRFFF